MRSRWKNGTKEPVNSGRVIIYFAWARNPDGQIEQLRVERGVVNGCEANHHWKQTWTGRTFRTER